MKEPRKMDEYMYLPTMTEDEFVENIESENLETLPLSVQKPGKVSSR